MKRQYNFNNTLLMEFSWQGLWSGTKQAFSPENLGRRFGQAKTGLSKAGSWMAQKGRDIRTGLSNAKKDFVKGYRTAVDAAAIKPSFRSAPKVATGNMNPLLRAAQLNPNLPPPPSAVHAAQAAKATSESVAPKKHTPKYYGVKS